MLFLGVIYIEHLRVLVFYRLFQLINSTNKPIPVYSYKYNQYDTRAFNMLNAALHAQPFLLDWYET